MSKPKIFHKSEKWSWSRWETVCPPESKSVNASLSGIWVIFCISSILIHKLKGNVNLPDIRASICVSVYRQSTLPKKCETLNIFCNGMFSFSATLCTSCTAFDNEQPKWRYESKSEKKK